MSNEEIVPALDRLSVSLLETKRRVSPVEARKDVNQAYIKLILACGFARVGAVGSARTTAAVGNAVLDKFREDPVHAFLADAFAARLDSAIAGGSRFAPLPKPLLDRRAALDSDRVAAYKVGRLFSALRVLDGSFERVDVPRRWDARLPQFDALPYEIDPDAADAELASSIASHLESSAGLSLDAGAARIAECLGRLLELPESSSMPLLSRALDLIDATPESPVELRAAALQVIAQHGWGELVPRTLDPLIPQLAATPGDRLGDPLDRTLQALRRLDHTAELAALLAALDPRLAELSGGHAPEASIAPIAVRYLIAGGLAYLGDRRGPAILDRLRGELDVQPNKPPTPMTLTQRLDWTRMLANGYALAPIPMALDNIASLLSQYRLITDSFATNSHFCISVLEFSDALVVALAQARIGRGPP